MIRVSTPTAVTRWVTRRVTGSARLLVGSVALAAVLSATVGCDRIKARRDLKDGNAAFRAGRFDKALEIYELVPPGSLDRVRADLNSGYAHMALYRPGSKHEKDRNHAEKAIEFFERYLDGRPDEEPSKDFPDPDEIRAMIINVLVDSERYRDAIAEMEADLEGATEPQRRIALISGLAQAYEKWGQPTTAMNYHLQVIEEEPELAGKIARWVSVSQICWNRSYREHKLMQPDERNRWIDIGIDVVEKAVEANPEHFEANVYLNLLLRERAKVRVDPDEIASLYVRAKEHQVKAKAIRDAQKAEEEAAKQEKEMEEGKPAGESDEPSDSQQS